MFIRSQAKFKVHFPKNLGGREPIKKMYRDGDLGSELGSCLESLHLLLECLLKV